MYSSNMPQTFYFKERLMWYFPPYAVNICYYNWLMKNLLWAYGSTEQKKAEIPSREEKIRQNGRYAIQPWKEVDPGLKLKSRPHLPFEL